VLRLLATDGSPVSDEAQEWIDEHVSNDLLIGLQVDAERTREFDRLALRAARHGLLKGYYPCAGQESIVALAHALAPHDWVFPAYREQGLRLTRGPGVAAELAMFAGVNAAWDPIEHRMMPANTAIGSHLPHAVGFARAQTMLGSDAVTVAVFGDGAAAEGDFHAAANLAGLWRAPAVLFCQNNQYAQSTPASAQSGGAGVAARGAGYGLRSILVDGMDPLAVLKASLEALEHARSGDGTTLVESVSYRFGGHSALDVRRRYRPRAEESEWRQRDPLLRLRGLIEHRGLSRVAAERSAETLAIVTREFDEALGELGRFAPPTYGTASEWVEPFTVRATPQITLDPHPGPGAMAATSAAVLGLLMDADERIVVIGEDVRDGGVLGATEGLAEQFGDRVLDASLNECGIVGAAIGMALAGLRPVAEIAFAGFAFTAFDQLAFHAARYRWRSGGALSVPLVVRMPAGGGHSGYEGHNESIESLFTHVPGLTVLAPSSADDAAGALVTAISIDGPVVLIESTRTYLDPDVRVEGGLVSPLELGRATSQQIGDGDPSITVVTYGPAAALVQEAADHLQGRGTVLDVIDLRSLIPWDRDAVLESLRRSGRLLVVHDSPRTSGFGAEVLARVAESGVPLLQPPVRLAQPDLPYGPALWEPLTEITAGDVIDAVLALVNSQASEEAR